MSSALPVARKVEEKTENATVVASPVEREKLVEIVKNCVEKATDEYDSGHHTRAVETCRNCAARYFLSDARLLDALRGEFDSRSTARKFSVYRKAFDDLLFEFGTPDRYYLLFEREFTEFYEKRQGWRVVPFGPKFSRCLAKSKSNASEVTKCKNWTDEKNEQLFVHVLNVNGEVHLKSYPAAPYDGVYTQDLAAQVSRYGSRPVYRKRRNFKPKEISFIDDTVKVDLLFEQSQKKSFFSFRVPSTKSPKTIPFHRRRLRRSIEEPFVCGP